MEYSTKNASRTITVALQIDFRVLVARFDEKGESVVFLVGGGLVY